MDARERLRRYLEQRRELGEQELVLDRLEVDDVLRLVGALGGTSAAAPSPSRPSPDRPSRDRASGGAAGAGQAADGPPADEQRAVGERAIEERAEERAAETRAGGPRVGEPAGSFSDWRETLRAAGGGPPGPVVPPGGAGRTETDEESEMARARKTGTTRAGGTDDAPAAPRPRTAAKAASKTAGSAAGPAAGSTAAAGSAATLPPWAAALEVPAGLSVGTGAALDETFAGLRTLDEIARATERCRRCDLYRTATHAVPGEGNPDAELVCVGEAPGANEDASGRPFVGAAGQLLTKILAAINLSRDDVFICNVLKHRPPGNRNPEPAEVEACSPYLLRQLELVKPKVILTLGTFAAQTLLATKTPIGKLRGQVHLYHGIPLVVTYHPAALLRNSAWKRPTWEDVQLARRLLDRAPGA